MEFTHIDPGDDARAKRRIHKTLACHLLAALHPLKKLLPDAQFPTGAASHICYEILESAKLHSATRSLLSMCFSEALLKTATI